MGVLNWMQTKLHGSHRRTSRKSEFIADADADAAQLADSFSELPQAQTDKLNDGCTTAMLSIGTFGERESHRPKPKSCGRLDELSRLQEELKSLLIAARGPATDDELGRVHHQRLERLLTCSSSSKNAGVVTATARQRSFRQRATRACGGFLPRPSLRETVPETRFNEILWGLLLKSAHPENPAFNDTVMGYDRAVQMGRKVSVEVEDESGKWIRTDSEYIVLEI